MEFSDRLRLLDPTPMPLELGFERVAGGVLHVAIRTDMHGCSGAMLDWWFGSSITDREYKWWHPLDHMTSTWKGNSTGTAVGSTHLVEERFTGSDPQKLSIQFRDPLEFFDADALAAARTAGSVSAIFCIRGGAGHAPMMTPDGLVLGTRLIHIARDTAWGLALRSHFFMGQDMAANGMPAEQIAAIFPDHHGAELLQHCYDEFTFLSRLLPSISGAEGESPAAIVRPW